MTASDGEDRTETLRAAVSDALAEGEPLSLCGAGTKAFYGRPVAGSP